MCDGAGGCQFVDLWLGSAHLLSGHRANFANPRLAEPAETTGQIGAGIENTHGSGSGSSSSSAGAGAPLSHHIKPSSVW